MHAVCAGCQTWFLIGLDGSWHVHLLNYPSKCSSTMLTNEESVRFEGSEPPYKLKGILWLLSVWLQSQPHVWQSNGERRRSRMDYGQIIEQFRSESRSKSWFCSREISSVELAMDSGHSSTVLLCFFFSRSLFLSSILFLSLFYLVLKQQQQSEKGREAGWPPASWQHWSECLYVCVRKRMKDEERKASHFIFVVFSRSVLMPTTVTSACSPGVSHLEVLSINFEKLDDRFSFSLFLCCAMGTFCQLSHIFISSRIWKRYRHVDWVSFYASIFHRIGHSRVVERRERENVAVLIRLSVVHQLLDWRRRKRLSEWNRERERETA